MRKQIAFGLAVVAGAVVIGTTESARVSAQSTAAKVAVAPPVVFQAAGPNIASIQSMVDAFRAALGGINNGNVPGPLPGGRREINWDGGGSTATSPAPTPFDGFLITSMVVGWADYAASFCWCFVLAACSCSIWTAIAQTKPKSSRPTAPSTFGLGLPRALSAT